MVDWTIVEKYPPNEITCRCGALFHAHAMFDKEKGRKVLRRPCPKCLRDDNFWKISSAPESMTLGPGDLGAPPGDRGK